jgi:serine/threonine-protein kinase RsbW
MPVPELLLQRGFDLDSLADARLDTHIVLCALGLPATSATAFVQAINEGMTNAIVHGGGEGELTLVRDDAIKVVASVWDGGHAPEFAVPARCPGAGASDGRGLWIAQALSDRLTVHTSPRGTTLGLELVLAEPE